MDIEVNKPKKKKGLIITIVILIFVILGLVTYICLDKFYFSENNKVTSDAQNKVDNSVDEKTLNILRDKLVTHDGSYGFYLGGTVTIDTITAKEILPYAILNYAYDNNIEFKNVPEDLEEDLSEVNSEKGKVPKSKIDNYIKKVFNTDREFSIDYDEDGDGYGEYLYLYGENKEVEYNIEKEIYNLVRPMGDMHEYSKVGRTFIKAEKNNEYINIYEKVAFCFYGFQYYACATNANADKDKELFNYNKFIKKPSIKGLTEKDINPEYALENFSDELETYRSTFKLADDGNYYWISTELVLDW